MEWIEAAEAPIFREMQLMFWHKEFSVMTLTELRDFAKKLDLPTQRNRARYILLLGDYFQTLLGS